MRWASNALLLALGLLLVADTAGRVLAAVSREPVREPGAASGDAGGAASRSWADREVILRRNLFSAAPGMGSQSAPDPVLEPSALPFALIGTFAASEASLSQAALYDRRAKATLVVGVGDWIEDRAVVARVERRRIVVREDGVERELALATGEGGPALRPPSSPERDVESELRRAGGEQARLRLESEGGAVVGLHVAAIETGSRFERMGVRDGDVITQVNGIPIDSSDAALRAVEQIVNGDGYHLALRRGDAIEHVHGRWEG